ncbi:MAG TPA: 3-keto-5-aminohexanoate cleavage protein [Dehalococcoidales bacterium]|nr:3-keto-5-aminohexanoate cleavage protein [Dehalococcoidales bacterium]
MRKVIITAALTGAGHGKEANPNLPEQPEEIIEQALQCRDAGAAVVHLHARDKSGNNSMSLDIFRKIHEGIKASSDLIVELSTGGGPTLPNEERIAPMLLKPEMASLNTFMMIMPVKGVETPFIYKRSEIEETARRARELGVKPAIAILNFTCLEEAENLIQKGLVDRPYVLDIGLNMPAQGTLRGTWQNLVALVERLPEGAVFNVAAGGEAELSLTTMGMLLGGNPRVGLEDNVYYAPGRPAKNNAELVARTARIARDLNLEIATPDEAREILQLRR